MTPQSAYDFIRLGGYLAAFLLILWGLLAKWWVPGWVYEESKGQLAEMRADRDYWRQTALSGSSQIGGAVSLIEQVVKLTGQQGQGAK